MPKSRKFEKLLRSTEKYYKGRKVPLKYRKQYGRRYSKAEARSIAYATARKKGWRT